MRQSKFTYHEDYHWVPPLLLKLAHHAFEEPLESIIAPFCKFSIIFHGSIQVSAEEHPTVVLEQKRISIDAHYKPICISIGCWLV